MISYVILFNSKSTLGLSSSFFFGKWKKRENKTGFLSSPCLYRLIFAWPPSCQFTFQAGPRYPILFCPLLLGPTGPVPFLCLVVPLTLQRKRPLLTRDCKGIPMSKNAGPFAFSLINIFSIWSQVFCGRKTYLHGEKFQVNYALSYVQIFRHKECVCNSSPLLCSSKTENY